MVIKMKQYIAFTKKEFLEVTRNYKLLIMGAVFLILGMMNPLTAKIMPTLMSSLLPEGMLISLAEPSAIDSWMQFYKNIPQMGLVVMVILFSGIMSSELSKGTLVNMLTKGLKRRTVILSKFTMAACVWTASFFMCFAVTYGYTAYFWKDNLNNVFFSALLLWVFGILLLCAMMLGGVLFKSSYGSLLFTVCFVVVQFLVGIIPKSEKYNPIVLATRNLDLINGTIELNDLFAPLVISVLLGVLLLSLSVIAFNKKSI